VDQDASVEDDLGTAFVGTFDGCVATVFEFDPAQERGAHHLVKACRSGDEDALAAALEWSDQAFVGFLRAQGTRRLLGVPVPSHQPGNRNRVAEVLIEAWSARGVMLPGFELLRRTALAPAAKALGHRDLRSEVQTLSWRESAASADADAILLVDDVLRSGNTVAACRLAIERDGGTREREREIFAFVLARADPALGAR
jgi:predicted amidophosphoribosyltransferase